MAKSKNFSKQTKLEQLISEVKKLTETLSNDPLTLGKAHIVTKIMETAMALNNWNSDKSLEIMLEYVYETGLKRFQKFLSDYKDN